MRTIIIAVSEDLFQKTLHIRRQLIFLSLAGMLLGLFTPPLQAEQYHYTVSYMKIPVLNVWISASRQPGLWTGQYRAAVKPAFSYIHAIDNIYTIKAEPQSWRPHQYIKQIHEGKHEYQQTFTYDLTDQRMQLRGGRALDFPQGTHSLFSAMLWVQHHDWVSGESRVMVVEIDGRRWQITLRCQEEPIIYPGDHRVKTALVNVTFDTVIGGGKLSGRTDYLSANIAASGRILQFWIDTSEDVIYQIHVPMKPFSVKAKLQR